MFEPTDQGSSCTSGWGQDPSPCSHSVPVAGLSSLNVLQPVHCPRLSSAGKQLSSFVSKDAAELSMEELHPCTALFPVALGWSSVCHTLEMLINKSHFSILAMLKSDASASVEGFDKDLPLEL